MSTSQHTPQSICHVTILPDKLYLRWLQEVQVKLPHCVPEGFKTVADDLLKNLLTCYEYLRGRMNQQQAGLQAARDGNPDSMSAVNN